MNGLGEWARDGCRWVGRRRLHGRRCFWLRLLAIGPGLGLFLGRGLGFLLLDGLLLGDHIGTGVHGNCSTCGEGAFVAIYSNGGGFIDGGFNDRILRVQRRRATLGQASRTPIKTTTRKLTWSFAKAVALRKAGLGFGMIAAALGTDKTNIKNAFRRRGLPTNDGRRGLSGRFDLG